MGGIALVSFLVISNGATAAKKKPSAEYVQCVKDAEETKSACYGIADDTYSSCKAAAGKNAHEIKLCKKARDNAKDDCKYQLKHTKNVLPILNQVIMVLHLHQAWQRLQPY